MFLSLWKSLHLALNYLHDPIRNALRPVLTSLLILFFHKNAARLNDFVAFKVCKQMRFSFVISKVMEVAFTKFYRRQRLKCDLVWQNYQSHMFISMHVHLLVSWQMFELSNCRFRLQISPRLINKNKYDPRIPHYYIIPSKESKAKT